MCGSPLTKNLTVSDSFPFSVTTSEHPTGDTLVEVEFRVPDTRYPLAALSAETGCETELLQILPRSDGAYTIFKRITGAPPDAILEFARESETVEARIVSESVEYTVVEFQVSESETVFAVTLIDAGAIPRELRSADGVAHIVAEIPPLYDASKVIDHFQTVYPSMEIVAQRQKDHSAPLFTEQDIKHVIEGVLTPRQHEVLVAAYAGGYYDWPREKTGEELADELGVTLATFSEHLRIAERKLLSLLFR